MRHLLVHLLVFSLVFGFPSFAFSAGPSDDFQWIFQKGEKKWLPQLELTGRPGNNDRYGMEIDPFIPIAQNDRSLIYLNVRNSLFWEEGDFSHEFNVGGGYRRLMGEDSWILGGYGFYDRMESRYNNVFNQGTLGVEALAWDWDARINGYIASSSDKSAPGAGGSKVSLSGTSLSMKTMREQAMSGVDAEVGYRLPFFGDDGVFSDMRLYAGGFFFDNDMVSSIAGPSARFEARIWEVPFLPAESRVTLGANYRWDTVRNSQVEGIVALRIPLGRPNRSEPLTHLERRMTDRVVRDVNIVTNTGLGAKEAVVTRTGVEIDDAYFFEEQKEVGRGLEPGGDGSFEDPFGLGEAVASGENNLLIGLARNGDIYAVNEELMPGQTVLGGGMPLYVWGAESGQKGMWVAPGEAATLTGFGAADFARAPYADSQAALILTENNTIAGLFFEGYQNIQMRDTADSSGGGALGAPPPSGYALELNLTGGTTMMDIYNNHFSQMEHAIEVDVFGGAVLQMYVWDNFFERMENGLDVWAPDDFQLTFDVYDNSFMNLDNGLDFALFPGGDDGNSFALNATGNLFSDNEVGIMTYVSHNGGDYTHNSYIANNEFWSNSRDDYELTIEGGDPSGEIDVNVEVAHNVSRNGDTFVDIETDDSIWAGQLNFYVHENTATGTGEGISIDIDDAPDVNVTIHKNEIIGAWDGDAINVDIDNSGDVDGHNITITQNWIENTDDDGIDVRVRDSYHTNVTVADNTVIDTGDSSSDNGIEIDFEGVGNGDGTDNAIMVSGNTVEFVNGGGNNIEVEVEGGEKVSSADTHITIEDNYLAYNDNGHGIELDLEDTGDGDGNTVTIVDNVINEMNESGIDIWLADLDGEGLQETMVLIAENDISHTVDDGDGNGIGINLSNVTNATITLMENNIDEANDNINGGDSGNGIEIEFSNSDGNTVEIVENTITRSGEHGIEIDLEDDGNTNNTSDNNTITINDNEIMLAGGNGIDVYVEDGNAGNMLFVGGNDISYVDDGIEIDDFDGSTMVGSDDINVVTYCLGDPTDISGTTGTIDAIGGVSCPPGP